MWAIQRVANDFGITTGLNAEGTPAKGKKKTLHLDNMMMDQMISDLEVPDPRVFTPVETAEGREVLEEAAIGGATEGALEPTEAQAEYFLKVTKGRDSGVSTNYQRAANHIRRIKVNKKTGEPVIDKETGKPEFIRGSIVDLSVRIADQEKGATPIETYMKWDRKTQQWVRSGSKQVVDEVKKPKTHKNVRGELVNWIPAQYVPESEMTEEQIKKAKEAGLPTVQVLESEALPLGRKISKPLYAEETLGFWMRPEVDGVPAERRVRANFVTVYKTSPEIIEVESEGGKLYRFDLEKVVYMNNRSSEIFNPKSERVVPTPAQIYEHVRKRPVPTKEAPGDFLSRISEPQYKEGDVYVPGTTPGLGEIPVGTKVYKVIDGETHYDKVYTVRQEKSGRFKLESELGRVQGWFTIGEIAVFNPSQVEIAKFRPVTPYPEFTPISFGKQRPLQKSSLSTKDLRVGNTVKLQKRALKRTLVEGIPKWSLPRAFKGGSSFLLVPDYTFANPTLTPKTFQVSEVGIRFITLHDVALGKDVAKVSVKLLAPCLNSPRVGQ